MLPETPKVPKLPENESNASQEDLDQLIKDYESSKNQSQQSARQNQVVPLGQDLVTPIKPTIDVVTDFDGISFPPDSTIPLGPADSAQNDNADPSTIKQKSSDPGQHQSQNDVDSSRIQLLPDPGEQSNSADRKLLAQDGAKIDGANEKVDPATKEEQKPVDRKELIQQCVEAVQKEDQWKNLSHIDQALALSRIKNTVVTPVDDYEIIQTLPNPFAQNEFIMVQHVTRNVRPNDCKLPQSDQSASINPVDDDLAVKNFILSELKQKNYQHNFYREFELEEVDDFIVSETKTSPQAFGNYKQKSWNGISDEQSEKKNQSKTFSVVSFWVQNHEEGRQSQCYRQCFIEDPVYLTIQSVDQKKRQMLRQFQIGIDEQIKKNKSDEEDIKNEEDQTKHIELILKQAQNRRKDIIKLQKEIKDLLDNKLYMMQSGLSRELLMDLYNYTKSEEVTDIIQPIKRLKLLLQKKDQMKRRELIHLSSCGQYLYYFTEGGDYDKQERESGLCLSIIDLLKATAKTKREDRKQAPIFDQLPLVGTKIRLKEEASKIVIQVLSDEPKLKNCRAPLLLVDDKKGFHLACQCRASSLGQNNNSSLDRTENTDLIIIDLATKRDDCEQKQSEQTVTILEREAESISDLVAFTVQQRKIYALTRSGIRVFGLPSLKDSSIQSSNDYMMSNTNKYSEFLYQHESERFTLVIDEDEKIAILSVQNKYLRIELNREIKHAEVSEEPRDFYGLIQSYKDKVFQLPMYITSLKILNELNNKNESLKGGNLTQDNSNESQLLQYELSLTDTSNKSINFTMQLHSAVSPNQALAVQIEQGECHFSPISTFDQNENVLDLTVFYRGVNTEVLRRKVCTVKAKRENWNDWSPNMFKPNDVNQNVNYVINYPLLAYTYPTPNITCINIAHLNQNKNQSIVNLRPYRLVQFVKTTRNCLFVNDQDDPENTQILFLVQNEQNNQVRLCYLACQGFLDPDFQIKMISGEVKMPTIDGEYKKMETILIKTPLDAECYMVLINQYNKGQFSEVHLSFISDNDKLYGSLLNLSDDEDNKNCKILPLKIQPGPGDSCLYVKKDNHSNSMIMSLSTSRKQKKGEDQKKIKQTELYRQPVEIIAWQRDHDTPYEATTYYTMQVIILDQSYMVQILSQQRIDHGFGEQISDDNPNPLEILTKIDLSLSGLHYKSYFDVIQKDQYASLILGRRSIIITHSIDKLHNESKAHFAKKVYNLKSDTQYVCDYLGMGHNYTERKDIESFIENKCRVLSFDHINFIGLNISLVKEGTMNYFETCKSIELRRIDLFDYQMQRQLVKQIKVVNGRVQVDTKNNKQIFFDIEKQLAINSEQQHEQTTKYIPYYYNKSGVLSQHTNESAVKTFWEDLTDQNPYYPYEHAKPTYDSEGKIIYVVILLKRKMETEYNKISGKEGNSYEVYEIQSEVFEYTMFNYKNQEKIQIQLTKNYLILLSDGIMAKIKLKYFQEGYKRKAKPVKLTDLNQYLGNCSSDNVRIDTISHTLLFENLEKEQDRAISPILLFNNLIRPRKEQDRAISPTLLFKNLIRPRKEQDRDNQKLRVYKDFIQITTSDRILILNLETSQQILTRSNYSDFLSSENEFVDLGAIQIIPETSVTGDQDFSQVERITHDEHKTVFCIPKVDYVTELATCFTLFSELDAQEFKYILKGEGKVKRIDPVSVLASIHGMTFFEQFSKYNVLIATVKDQIVKQMKDESIENDQTSKIQIHLRNIYNLLLQPVVYDHIKKTKKTKFWQNWRAYKEYELSKQPQLLFEYEKERKIKKICEATQEEGAGLISVDDLIQEVSAELEMRRSKNESRINLMQRTINRIGTDFGEIEGLIELLMLSEETSLTDLVYDFESFKTLFESMKSSPIISLFFQNKSMIENKSTTAIQTLRLDSNIDRLVFGSPSSLLDEYQIRQRFNKALKEKKAESLMGKLKALLEKLKLEEVYVYLSKLIKPYPEVVKKVQVTIVEINWLNHNVKKFIEFLPEFYDQNIFKNELIKNLLLEQAQSSRKQIKPYMLLYFFYMICCIIFQVYYITGVNGSRSDGMTGGSGWAVFMKFFIFIYSITFLNLEFNQAKGRPKEYLQDKWNIINLATFGSNLVILSIYMWNDDYDPIQLSTACSVASFLLWFQAFYWLRFYESISFYVKIVLETMWDIRWFFLLFMVCVAMFANAQLILHLALQKQAQDCRENGQEQESEYAPLIDLSVDNYLINALISQYLSGISGGGNTENYEGSAVRGFVWTYYLASTIFLTINFLNVLIAIVSDTYEKINESRAQYALQQQVEIYADFINLTEPSPTITENRFLYVLQAAEVYDESTDWTGGIDALKKVMKRDGQEVKEMIVSNMKNQQSQLLKLQSKLDSITDKQQSQLDTLRHKLDSITDNHHQLKSSNDNIKEQLNNSNEKIDQILKLLSRSN